MPNLGRADDWEVEPTEGDPFSDSPQNYDVQPVDFDPFAAADQFGLASRQPEATPSSAGGLPQTFVGRGAGPGQALPDDLRRRLALISQPRPS
jgi:hypothetical protein